MENKATNIRLENKSRVNVCLVDHPQKRGDIFYIINEIKNEFKAVTHSRIVYKKENFQGRIRIVSDAVYRGHWFSNERDKFIEDPIHLIFVDIDTSQKSDFLDFFLKIQDKIKNKFNEDEVWVTCSNIFRFF